MKDTIHLCKPGKTGNRPAQAESRNDIFLNGHAGVLRGAGTAADDLHLVAPGGFLQKKPEQKCDCYSNQQCQTDPCITEFRKPQRAVDLPCLRNHLVQFLPWPIHQIVQDIQEYIVQHHSKDSLADIPKCSGNGGNTGGQSAAQHGCREHHNDFQHGRHRWTIQTEACAENSSQRVLPVRSDIIQVHPVAERNGKSCKHQGKAGLYAPGKTA